MQPNKSLTFCKGPKGCHDIRFDLEPLKNSVAGGFKVTFLSFVWRSLSLWKGHITIPKRSQRIARCICFSKIKYNNCFWSWMIWTFWNLDEWEDGKCVFGFVCLVIFYFVPWDSWPLNQHLDHLGNIFYFFPTTEQASLSVRIFHTTFKRKTTQFSRRP